MPRTPAQVRYYWRNQAKILAKLKLDHQLNPEKYKARHRANHIRHRKRNNAQCAAYLASHREEINARKRRYYKENRDRILETIRANRAENIDSERAKDREDYWKNREKRLAEMGAYAKRYPEKALARVALRRARKMSAETTPDADLRIAWMKKSARRLKCYWCGIRLSRRTLTVDHIVAIARGGSHTASNLCASCKPCNCSKNAKALTEWKKSGQQVLPL